MHENFANMGNDNIMRLTVVRDLIAWPKLVRTRPNTAWFRPEGLLLHWSRYIDAGIAAIIVPLSRFIEMDLAEQIAATAWPTLIFLLLLTSVGFGTRKGVWCGCCFFCDVVSGELAIDGVRTC